MKFSVRLSFDIEAETSADALDMSIDAAEFLLDTFNDDDVVTINPLMSIDVQPKEEAHAISSAAP